MKIASCLALTLFLSAAEAFGPASPVNGNAFGLSSKASHGMTMRVGKVDLSRKQRFNDVLATTGALSSKEAVQEQLLSSDVNSLIQKSSYKVRRAMIRKVNLQASRQGVDVPLGFGVPPTQAEREAAEMAAGAAAKVEKEAYFAALPAQMVAAKAARVQKKADKKARAAANARAPAAVAEVPVVEEPVVEAPVAEAPVAEAPAAEAPGPAATSGGPVTPQTIKQLRDETGAGMMDCKKALLETNGDQEAAAEYLRTKGLAKADKKASRIAAEGKIVTSIDGGRAVMVEVNCETDFVGKDSSFLEYCDKVASAAININDDSIDALMAQEVGGESLEATRQGLVAKIGENIQVRRMASGGGEGKTVGVYVHMNRIGVLVELEGGDENTAVDIGMHVAAMSPPYAKPEDVPQDVLEKEKKFLTEQAMESGKPLEIAEKMVAGRIRKYLEEICLVSQNYVKDSSMTVEKYLATKGAKMIGFKRIAVGEGIEKKKDDFAAEVAAMAAGKA